MNWKQVLLLCIDRSLKKTLKKQQNQQKQNQQQQKPTNKPKPKPNRKTPKKHTNHNDPPFSHLLTETRSTCRYHREGIIVIAAIIAP